MHVPAYASGTCQCAAGPDPYQPRNDGAQRAPVLLPGGFSLPSPCNDQFLRGQVAFGIKYLEQINSIGNRGNRNFFSTAFFFEKDVAKKIAKCKRRNAIRMLNKHFVARG